MRRLAVYAFHDSNGIVDEYVLFFLRGLRNVSDTIRVVSAGELNEESRKALAAVSDELKVLPAGSSSREAFREGLKAENAERLTEYDELILSNDEWFGPVFPFREMFNRMAEKDAGCWGLTDGEGPGMQEGGPFFRVYRKAMLQSPDWMENLFSAPQAVYCDTACLDGFSENPLNDFPRFLLEELRCPLIPRGIFFHSYGNTLKRSGGEAVREAFSFLREETGYDTGMMLKHLLRTQNLADLKKKLHWNYIVTTKHERKNSSAKHLTTALVFHLFFPDLMEECAAYAAHMPPETDLFITVPDAERLEKAKAAFAAVRETHRTEFRLAANRGRDLVPFLVTCRDVLQKYDLVLKLHDKKCVHLVPLSLGKSWQHQCFECLAANESFVKNVITLFEENPRLGILAPPPPLHGPYFATTGDKEWGENYPLTKGLYDELKLKVPISPEKEPVAPFGSVFWARTDALRLLTEKGWRAEDFPEEPLPPDATVLHGLERLFPFAAQERGYYTGWVFSDTWARIHFDNWSYELGGLTRLEAEKNGGWSSFREMTEKIRKKQKGEGDHADQRKRG